jgi:hypothetical protein
MGQGDGKRSRKDLYTNAANVFDGAADVPYFHLHLDTWYYCEWADPNHFATLGNMPLGEGPLTAAQGVGAFVTRHVAAFRDAFAGLLRPALVQVSYKPRLSDVVDHEFRFAAPATQEDL